MYGTIVGDICGSYYEFKDQKGFFLPLTVSGHSTFTDDTALSCATAAKLMGEFNTYTEAYRATFHRYKDRNCNGEGSIDIGYGSHFTKWASGKSTEGYGSKGNGSAMRIAPVAYVARSEAEVLEIAKESAEATHNTHEAIFAAQATALAIFLSLKGELSASQVNREIEMMSFDTYLSHPNPYLKKLDLKDLNRNYRFSAMADLSVPIAIKIGLTARSYEEAVRMSLYVGGDSDTIAGIAGSIAEARHGIPKKLLNKSFVLALYAPELSSVANNFYEQFCKERLSKNPTEMTTLHKLVWKLVDKNVPLSHKLLKPMQGI